MSRTTKTENLQLEQAYNQVFVKSIQDQNVNAVPVEETSKEEPEDDKMAAAVAIQQTADEVEDQGGEVNQQLKKAKQESEKYVNTKISQFKAK
tara:strand:+ start:4765 stop:5043 length:279 start_codon:yes stop_codon:yes gene_type:complete